MLFFVEKWTKGHKCATIVQLHEVRELWELLSSESYKLEPEFEDYVDQFMILLSIEAVSN